MRLKTLATTAVVLSGISGVALAQAPRTMDLGPYVGAGAGRSDFDIGSSNWGIGVGTDDHTDTAWRVFAGMRLLEFVGVEVGYIDFGETTGSGRARAKARGVDLVALGALPVYRQGPHQLDLFAKAGGYWWDSSVRSTGPTSNLRDTDDFDYTFGFGAQYHFDNIGVRAEWQRYHDVFGKVDTDVVMGSVMFRF